MDNCLDNFDCIKMYHTEITIIWQDLRIVKTCEDGIGRRSGLKIGDRITMCCTIQDQHVKEYRSCKNIKEILESENQQCNLVLFINRGNDC